MKYIYHYSGSCPDGMFRDSCVEGIVTSPCMVNSMREYMALKKEIADMANTTIDKLTIKSFSFLHSEP